MAFDLPKVGVISYNGYSFDATAQTRVTGRPEYDRAGRTVTHVVWTFRVSAFVAPRPGQGNADTALEDVRRRLSQPGQALTVTGKGFGLLDLNLAGARDVVWGPKPRVLDWEPVGGGRVARVEWHCEVAVPECANARFAFAVMAFNFESDYTIDANGLQRRIYTGYLEVPQTRVLGGRRPVLDNPDRYFAQIQPELPFGFRRLTRHRHISADKRRLDFTIVDEQLPTQGGLPQGCTEASGRFDVASHQTMLTTWDLTAQATYTLGPGVHRVHAVLAFLALLADRVRHLRRSGRAGAKSFETDFQVTEGLYQEAHRVSLRATWTVAGVSLRDILLASGLFREVPGTDWRLWRQSVAAHLSPYGNGGLIDSSAFDAIVDLCGGGMAGLLRAQQPGVNELRGGRLPGGIAELRNFAPGWLKYENHIELEADYNQVRHKRLGTVELKGGNPHNRLGRIDAHDAALIEQFERRFGRLEVLDDLRPQKADLVQYRADGTWWVTMRGCAARVGGRTGLPALVEVGGVPVRLEKAKGGEFVAGSVGGQPVFAARWAMRYALPAPPLSGVRIAANPQAVPPGEAKGRGG